MSKQDEKSPISNENASNPVEDHSQSNDNIQNVNENIQNQEEEEQININDANDQYPVDTEDQTFANEEEQEFPDDDDNYNDNNNYQGDDQDDFEESSQENNNDDDDDDDFYNIPESTGDTPDILGSSTDVGGEVDDFYYQICPMINACRGYFCDFTFEDYLGKRINFTIPTSILPLSISVFNEFHNDPVLVNVTIEPDNENPWKNKPIITEVTNPIHGKSFSGSILLQDRISLFFSKDYKPKEKYRCQSYVLAPQNKEIPKYFNELVANLMNSGFSEKKCKKALEFCSFDVDKAREYLITGILEPTIYPLPLDYREHPLFYLVLEICESFFDMCYCCCNCDKELGVFSLKPSCCSDEKCVLCFTELGAGSNVIGEIKRDRMATDFIISLASAAFYAPPTPPVFDPRPTNVKDEKLAKFFKTLPSMDKICQNCSKDRELIDMINLENFHILRFFILMNKAQLITLDKQMQVKIGNFDGYQFLASFVSPESEIKFIQKKKEYGVKWFWHGSLTNRWYRIMHTGLKDFGNTQYQVNAGPIHGTGIYMSDSFAYSYCYCRPQSLTENYYVNSKLPKTFIVMALTENADVPGLSKQQVYTNEFTQKDEEACITRVLFLMDDSKGSNAQINFNSVKTPPKVVSLSDVLKHKMKTFHII